LGILARDLHQPEEAARLAVEKKTVIVDFLDRLFAAPFATLTPEQREAVETWCPPGMEIPAPRAHSAYVGDNRLRGTDEEDAPEEGGPAEAGDWEEDIPFEEEGQTEAEDA
ncbi:MAG: hypothetical protein Q4P24_17130, partial [Rhodobacterales bacterium]|nr:hypothetical protein [Rhodobacterales bacterium]